MDVNPLDERVLRAYPVLMSKNQKASTNKGDRNPNRKNGKAAKKNPGQHRGGSPNPLSETQKALMGKGLAQKWRLVIDGKVRGL